VLKNDCFGRWETGMCNLTPGNSDAINVTEGAIGSAEGKQEGVSGRCMEGLVGRREERGNL
jgi:hypothetical protein